MLPCGEKFNAEFGSVYLANLRRRDPQTEAHFAVYFSRYLESKLRARLRSRDLADDIRQETLVRVLEAIYTRNDLRHPERFGAFVNSVCNHVLLEHWRRGEVAGEKLEAAEQIDPRHDPESAVQLAQEIAEVKKVLPKLQERDRQLLRMIYWDEYDRREISRITHISPDHVRVRLHRAKRAVRKCLDERRGQKATSPNTTQRQRKTMLLAA